MSLSDVLGKITTIEVLPEKTEKHYFVVELENVSGSSDLLNIDAAKSYISQVAPLPYQSRHFIYISQLKEFLKDHGYSIDFYLSENELDNAVIKLFPQGDFYYRAIPTVEEQRAAMLREINESRDENEFNCFEDIVDAYKAINIVSFVFAVEKTPYS